MKKYIASIVLLMGVLLVHDEASGRGFGGFRGGGGFGGYRGDSFSGYRNDSFGGGNFARNDSFANRGDFYRNNSFGGYRGNDFSGYRNTYDRPTGGPQVLRFDDSPRTFSPGESRLTFPTDAGLSHYSALNVASAHTTNYWSNSVMANRGTYVRNNFNYYNSFRGGWYANHPLAWRPAAWLTGVDAWSAVYWGNLWDWWGMPYVAPVNYDYGNTIVYQGNDVNVNGSEAGTAEQYASQAINLATQGQQAEPPATDQWQSLGVFALVQGEEKTSNNLFQLAVNQAGTIRGNYYDGVMDTTTPVYGSVDKKTQRAAWSIGKKTDRVFDAGIYNLTLDQCPVLVHFGKDRTQQWLLVRVQQQPKQ